MFDWIARGIFATCFALIGNEALKNRKRGWPIARGPLICNALLFIGTFLPSIPHIILVVAVLTYLVPNMYILHKQTNVLKRELEVQLAEWNKEYEAELDRRRRLQEVMDWQRSLNNGVQNDDIN